MYGSTRNDEVNEEAKVIILIIINNVMKNHLKFKIFTKVKKIILICLMYYRQW